MARLRTWKTLAINADPEVIDKMIELAKENGRSRTMECQQAFKEYIAKYYKEKPQSPHTGCCQED